MNDLGIIKAKPKSGSETLSFNGKNIPYNLLDFWRWSVSDILSNATRGRFAEFVVGTAINIKPENLRNEWGAFDLTTEDGIKIEIKSAAYIQCWNQRELSKISFSIRPAKWWDPESNLQSKEANRHADVYVFCLLHHLDQSTIDPLKWSNGNFM